MFKKTKVRSILELLGKNLSAREVSKVLGISRNTAAEVLALFLQSGRSRDDISEWDYGRLYGLFYPDKFKYKPRYAPVDYSYVHKELKKTGVTEKLLWEEYCAKYEKDGVNACSYITFAKNYKKFTADKNYTEPDTGERITAYLFVATMPASVKKPKQKASVEGSVGKIATAVIAKLRNDTFPSLAALNAGIRKAVKEFNDKPFQKPPEHL